MRCTVLALASGCRRALEGASAASVCALWRFRCKGTLSEGLNQPLPLSQMIQPCVSKWLGTGSGE